MNPHRIDFVSLLLFNLVARTGSISKGAALAHLAGGAIDRHTEAADFKPDFESVTATSQHFRLSFGARPRFESEWRKLVDPVARKLRPSSTNLPQQG
jgi:hypothetical protein